MNEPPLCEPHPDGPRETLPRAPACERNREPILAALRGPFANRRSVLEVGSGTGQHAVHFAQAMPWLIWQCSDLAIHLPGIRDWLDTARLPNTPPPIDLAFDEHGVCATNEPCRAAFDALFTANTLHIMSWPQVQALFRSAARLLADEALMAVYGPFHRDGRATGAGNEQFDRWLKAHDPQSGVRDLRAVDALAVEQGFQLQADVPMPADNALLFWRRG